MLKLRCTFLILTVSIMLTACQAEKQSDPVKTNNTIALSMQSIQLEVV